MIFNGKQGKVTFRQNSLGNLICVLGQYKKRFNAKLLKIRLYIDSMETGKSHFSCQKWWYFQSCPHVEVKVKGGQ